MEKETRISTADLHTQCIIWGTRPSLIPQPKPEGTRAVNQLSESMRIAQAGNDAETRRNLFFDYLEDENAAVRYAMSQNKLTGQLEGTTSMMSLNEYRPDGTLNPMYEGNGRGNERKKSKETTKTDHSSHTL